MLRKGLANIIKQSTIADTVKCHTGWLSDKMFRCSYFIEPRFQPPTGTVIKSATGAMQSHSCIALLFKFIRQTSCKLTSWRALECKTIYAERAQLTDFSLYRRTNKPKVPTFPKFKPILLSQQFSQYSLL